MIQFIDCKEVVRRFSNVGYGLIRKMNVEIGLKGNFMDLMLLLFVCERNVKKIFF